MLLTYKHTGNCSNSFQTKNNNNNNNPNDNIKSPKQNLNPIHSILQLLIGAKLRIFSLWLAREPESLNTNLRFSSSCEPASQPADQPVNQLTTSTVSLNCGLFVLFWPSQMGKGKHFVLVNKPGLVHTHKQLSSCSSPIIRLSFVSIFIN